MQTDLLQAKRKRWLVTEPNAEVDNHSGTHTKLHRAIRIMRLTMVCNAPRSSGGSTHILLAG